MLKFSDRLLLANIIANWQEKNRLMKCNQTTIDYLMLAGFLDEDKIKKYLEIWKANDNGEKIL